MKLENLVGREVLCTQDYYGVTKGKEYTIIDFNGNYFSIIEDGGKEQKWSTSYLDSKEYFELLPKEPQFKLGDKVLVSDDGVEWFERLFVLEYKGNYYCETESGKSLLIYWDYIKPYEDEIKVGDWVKRISDETIWKIRDIGDVNAALNSECTKITNPQLIELLNKELL